MWKLRKGMPVKIKRNGRWVKAVVVNPDAGTHYPSGQTIVVVETKQYGTFTRLDEAVRRIRAKRGE